MKALVNTLAFSALYVPLTVVLSLWVAMGLNRNLPGLSLFRIAFFLPTVSSAHRCRPGCGPGSMPRITAC